MAAEQGDAGAQYRLGGLCVRGWCAERGDGEAAKWYRKAAEQGLALAQYSLGEMYREGRGVPQDVVQVYAWFDAVAHQGSDLHGIAEVGKQTTAFRMSREEMSRAQALARQYWKAYVEPFQ